jgi:hypothetical protein
MGLTGGTFLHQVKQIITGAGFLKSVQIPVMSVHLFSSGAPLTTTISSNPGPDKFGTNITGLSWAADKVVKAGFDIIIPRDYDESQDHCKLVFRAKMAAGDTDTPGLDAVAYHEDATTTDLDPTISADLSTTLADVKIDLSGNSFNAGDQISVGVFPEAHSSEAVQVYGIELEYRSTLVYFDKDSAR